MVQVGRMCGPQVVVFGLAKIMPLPIRPPSEGPNDSDHILRASNIEKIHNYDIVYLM